MIEEEGLGTEEEDVVVDEEFKAIVVENVKTESDGGVIKVVEPRRPEPNRGR